MATRVYLSQSPLGVQETATLEADSWYKADFGPTLGWVLIKGSDSSEAITKRDGILNTGLLGTRVGQPL